MAKKDKKITADPVTEPELWKQQYDELHGSNPQMKGSAEHNIQSTIPSKNTVGITDTINIPNEELGFGLGGKGLTEPNNQLNNPKINNVLNSAPLPMPMNNNFNQAEHTIPSTKPSIKIPLDKLGEIHELAYDALQDSNRAANYLEATLRAIEILTRG